MGKDLKGKELGEGIYQQKNNKYCARVSGFGKRLSKTFDNLAEAKIWVAERQLKNEPMAFSGDMTLNDWFDYWIDEIKRPTIKISTYEWYKDRYNHDIRKELGLRLLRDIKPLDCQAFFNNLNHKGRTTQKTKICLKQLLDSAVDNELIDHTPMKKIKIKQEEKKERRVFTADEQSKFICYVERRRSKYSDMWLLMLETGLRTGEVLGLKWSDIDFAEKKINVNRNVYYSRELKRYIEQTPKSASGKRTIPLTQRAIDILKGRKVVGFEWVYMTDFSRKVNLDESLHSVCKTLDLEPISAHGLRHSFATRCIEAGMRPKTLQKILGHSTLQMTMDLYVHVTDDTLIEEMGKFERLVMNW